jgi:SAM-dependent methyltransferase
MDNQEYLYRQYDKINWANQINTEINSTLNRFIIEGIINQHSGTELNIFDIGFGVGQLFETLIHSFQNKYENLYIEGCEPASRNYNYFINNSSKNIQNVVLKTHNDTFLNVESDVQFDFITAIYVFPHIVFEDLESTVHKIHSMLRQNGKFILVVANEDFINAKLERTPELVIQENELDYYGSKYHEIIHFSDLPEIGRLIDINRDEKLYEDILLDKGFELIEKSVLDDSGFICSIFVFQK